MIKRRPLLVAGLVLLAGGAVAFSFRSKTTSVTEGSYHTVKRGDFLVSIVEGGTLAATSELVVRNETEYSLQIINLVQEGAYVAKGDLLVELDSSSIREKVTAQELALENADYTLKKSVEDLEITKLTWDANVQEATLRVEFAKSDLEKYKMGDWPILKRANETRLIIAEEELSRANDRLRWTEQLITNGYATEVELKADQLNVKKQELSIAQNRQEMQIAEKYDYPKRVRVLESAVRESELDLLRMKQKARSNLEAATSDVDTKKRTLELQTQRMADYKKQLELTKVFAPSDGIVVYHNSSSSRYSMVEIGASIPSRYQILKLPDVSQMMLEIKVHESHVRQVRPGLPCYVTIDSLPGKRFTGFVRRVAPLPDSQSRYYNPNLKVYDTEIWVNEKLSDLKPGVSGRAEIIITNLTGVLTVPIQAVTTIKGKQICYVNRDGADTSTEVEAGWFNQSMIEVRQGLQEGDRVQMSPLSSADAISLSGGTATSEDMNGAEAPKAPTAEELLASQKKALQEYPPGVNPNGSFSNPDRANVRPGGGNKVKTPASSTPTSKPTRTKPSKSSS